MLGVGLGVGFLGLEDLIGLVVLEVGLRVGLVVDLVVDLAVVLVVVLVVAGDLPAFFERRETKPSIDLFCSIVYNYSI